MLINLANEVSKPFIFTSIYDILIHMKIIDHWPFNDKKPRKTQIEAFEWLEENQDKKYLFVEMPVGGGKSNLGISFSCFLSPTKGDSFILTPQRILQHQYEQTFSPNLLTSLYGKNNYECRSKKTTCDIGCIVKPSCKGCSYEIAKAKAKEKPNLVLNYTYAMLAFGYTEIFDPRRLMILDECHNLEDHLTEFDSTTIGEWRTKKLNISWVKSKTFEGVYSWLKSVYLPASKKYYEEVFSNNESLLDKSGRDLTPNDLKRLKDMTALEDHIDSVEGFVCSSVEDLKKDFVLVQDTSSVKFKRLSGEHAFHSIIEPKANQFLFMSSTILNYEGYCKDIGLDPSQAAFISLDSEFPVENRPVYYMPKMKMNSSWKNPENKDGRELIKNGIKEILEMHKDDSGIIHTSNFQISRWLVEELTGNAPQQILHHNPDSGDDRNSIINAFQLGKRPKVLISPSITEGLDFKDDLSRFAIFAKVPFGYIGDQWIKRRMELSQEWYMRRALIDIIQGGGRVVRSDTDWGNVYILDASFTYLLNQTRFMVPKWWMESFKTLNN